MEIVFTSPESKKAIKWLWQFCDKDDPKLSAVYIIKDRLIATDQYSLGSIPIPMELTEFCDDEMGEYPIVGFQIIAINAKPSLLILNKLSDDPKYEEKREQIMSFLESAGDKTPDDAFVASLAPALVAKITGMPGDKQNYYISEWNNPVIVKTDDAKAIIMPMAKNPGS